VSRRWRCLARGLHDTHVFARGDAEALTPRRWARCRDLGDGRQWQKVDTLWNQRSQDRGRATASFPTARPGKEDAAEADADDARVVNHETRVSRDSV
jgi:hypothetical protein